MSDRSLYLALIGLILVTVGQVTRGQECPTDNIQQKLDLLDSEEMYVMPKTGEVYRCVRVSKGSISGSNFFINPTASTTASPAETSQEPGSLEIQTDHGDETEGPEEGSNTDLTIITDTNGSDAEPLVEGPTLYFSNPESEQEQGTSENEPSNVGPYGDGSVLTIGEPEPTDGGLDGDVSILLEPEFTDGGPDEDGPVLIISEPEPIELTDNEPNGTDGLDGDGPVLIISEPEPIEPTDNEPNVTESPEPVVDGPTDGGLNGDGPDLIFSEPETIEPTDNGPNGTDGPLDGPTLGYVVDGPTDGGLNGDGPVLIISEPEPIEPTDIEPNGTESPEPVVDGPTDGGLNEDGPVLIFSEPETIEPTDNGPNVTDGPLDGPTLYTSNPESEQEQGTSENEPTDGGLNEDGPVLILSEPEPIEPTDNEPNGTDGTNPTTSESGSVTEAATTIVPMVYTAGPTTAEIQATTSPKLSTELETFGDTTESVESETTSVPHPCADCNCNINMNPDGRSAVQVLESPNYPDKYWNNLECSWIITTNKNAKIGMVFDSFNIQWSRDCVSKDYLFVGAVAKYTKVTMCGSKLPQTFKLRSKKNKMYIKFVSDKKVRRSGFRATLVAS